MKRVKRSHDLRRLESDSRAEQDDIKVDIKRLRKEREKKLIVDIKRVEDIINDRFFNFYVR